MPTESARARAERIRRERYDVFDRLMDLSRDGDLSREAAFAIYRDLTPPGAQQVLPGSPHLHELDANAGEEWCMDCGVPARDCRPEVAP
ncbi:hypothetical protein MF406_01960 [Georgenia sp. TF02-10]|uniref:hypothetical protein n=1 Tax=Georgenia sp. TF02-10 TaxID=2917725 RepID=UPI001FA8065A|nr:hypothetical protein [Georgenia sp. TF02-10]UNX55075.1 hypothetical protein MF406_01960 [Georgenia sp. TF02-10]